MGKLILSREEREELLKGIEEAQRRLFQDYGEDMTEEDGRELLRETLGEPLWKILRNHKEERKLT